MESPISFVEQTVCTQEVRQTVQRFVNQLTSTPVSVSETLLAELVASADSHLFFLYSDNQVVGMATVGTYLSPTGRKAWVEDVVVDEAFRGRGLGAELMRRVMDFAASLAPVTLMLTSKPARVAANRLYRSIGFEPKETNVYKQVYHQDQ